MSSDRERLISEESEKMCESCCNFDKEHIGMDGFANCKLTMTFAYAEDNGGNCMFYNVPKEQIIIPPCKVGDTVYVVDGVTDDVVIGVITHLEYNIFTTPREWITVRGTYPFFGELDFKDRIDLLIGKTVFLTKEETEQALKERAGKNEWFFILDVSYSVLAFYINR